MTEMRIYAMTKKKKKQILEINTQDTWITKLLDINLKITMFHMSKELSGRMDNFNRQLKTIKKESNENSRNKKYNWV